MKLKTLKHATRRLVNQTNYAKAKIEESLLQRKRESQILKSLLKIDDERISRLSDVKSQIQLLNDIIKSNNKNKSASMIDPVTERGIKINNLKLDIEYLYSKVIERFSDHVYNERAKQDSQVSLNYLKEINEKLNSINSGRVDDVSLRGENEKSILIELEEEDLLESFEKIRAEAILVLEKL